MKKHNCFVTADNYLRQKNTKLAFAIELPTGEERLIIHTEKLDNMKKVKPARMLATFCPFCGQQLP